MQQFARRRLSRAVPGGAVYWPYAPGRRSATELLCTKSSHDRVMGIHGKEVWWRNKVVWEDWIALLGGAAKNMHGDATQYELTIAVLEGGVMQQHRRSDCFGTGIQLGCKVQRANTRDVVVSLLPQALDSVRRQVGEAPERRVRLLLSLTLQGGSSWQRRGSSKVDCVCDVKRADSARERACALCTL